MVEQNATQEAIEVEFASRLTIKDLGCDPSKVKKLPEGQTKLALARMYGIVSRVGFQEDRNTGATYTFFVGSFEGINLETGETVQANKMYLPEGASESLESIVSQVQTKRGKSASVNFAFEIRALKSTNSKSGYVYETAAILQPDLADPLKELRGQVVKATASTGKPKLETAPAATGARKSA